MVDQKPERLNKKKIKNDRKKFNNLTNYINLNGLNILTRKDKDQILKNKT